MEEFAIACVFILGAFGLLVGFNAIDNWHKRKAWRDADRDARRFMRNVRGVEQGPDGKWRKL